MSAIDHSYLLEFIGKYSDVLGEDTTRKIAQEMLENIFSISSPKLISTLEGRLDAENIPTVKRSLSYSKWGLYYYGGLCSRSALANFEGDPLIKIEERVGSPNLSWSITGPLFEGSELSSRTSVSIDDVFSLIQKDWMNVDENNLAMPNETICEIKLSDDETMLTIGTKSIQIIAKIDNRENYSDYGGFIICEDEYDLFVGSNLRRVYLTDTFYEAKDISIIKRIPDIEQILDIEAEEADPEYIHYYVDNEGNKWGTLSNISFINFETDKGILQFVVYNYHNGYYGHDVSITINHQVIYKTVV